MPASALARLLVAGTRNSYEGIGAIIPYDATPHIRFATVVTLPVPDTRYPAPEAPPKRHHSCGATVSRRRLSHSFAGVNGLPRLAWLALSIERAILADIDLSFRPIGGLHALIHDRFIG